MYSTIEVQVVNTEITRLNLTIKKDEIDIPLSAMTRAENTARDMQRVSTFVSAVSLKVSKPSTLIVFSFKYLDPMQTVLKRLIHSYSTLGRRDGTHKVSLISPAS